MPYECGGMTIQDFVIYGQTVMQMLYGSRCFGSQQSIGDDKKKHTLVLNWKKACN